MTLQDHPSVGVRAAIYIGTLVAVGVFYALGRFVSNLLWNQPQQHGAAVVLGAVRDAGYDEEDSLLKVALMTPSESVDALGQTPKIAFV